MKKLVSILCLVALMVTLLAPAVSFAKTTAWVKTGNGKNLYMREEPSKNGEIVTSLPYRTQLIVYEYANGWALCEPADWSMSNPKWVSTSFLVYSDPGPYKGNNEKKNTDSGSSVVYPDLDKIAKKIKYLDEPVDAVIKTSRPTNYVHLRWYPSKSAAYIDQYLCDTEITVLAQSNEWSQVQVKETGYVGFILTNNVDMLAE